MMPGLIAFYVKAIPAVASCRVAGRWRSDVDGLKPVALIRAGLWL